VAAKHNVLVVDDEEELRELYKLILAEELDLNIAEAGSGHEALEILKANPNFDLIVSDYNMPKGNGEVVFTKAQELGIPFILVTSDRKEDHPIFNDKPLTVYIQKPFSEIELCEAAKKLFQEKRRFISISLASLLKIGTLSVPIYFELPSKKLLKVFNPGDVFNDEAFRHWTAKNVSSLLVMKDDFQNLVGDFKSQILNEVFFKSNEFDTTKALIVSSQILEVLTNASKILEINNDIIELTQKNIELVTRIIASQSDLKRLLDAQTISDSSGIHARSHLTALIATWASYELKLSYPRSGELLTMAAFFHDIGLDDEIIRNESHFIQAIKVGSRMNKDHVQRVRKHIDVAVTLLKRFRGCPQEVIRIVAEHHERPDGSGFPKGLTGDKISELSAVFIIAHEFVTLFFDPSRKISLKSSWTELGSIYSSHQQFDQIYKLFLNRIPN